MRPHRRAATLGVAVIVTIVLLGSMMVRAGETGHDSPAGLSTPPITPTPILHTSLVSPTPSHAATATQTADVDHDSTLQSLIESAGSGGASVSAVNMVTGRHVTAGATHGMLEASVSKIALLEILLLERQQAGKLLSDDEDDELTEMIEQSSNAAADEVFELAGGHDKVVSMQTPLGLNTKITVYGASNLWGLTTSSASQQVILLRNLVDDESPLNAASRDYALDLLGHVEADQRWGVPSAADKGSKYYVKNGWLAVDDDHDLWAVNSDGIITVHGQQVLVSVMTQHDASFDDGIDLNEKLAKAVVAAVG